MHKWCTLFEKAFYRHQNEYLKSAKYVIVALHVKLSSKITQPYSVVLIINNAGSLSRPVSIGLSIILYSIFGFAIANPIGLKLVSCCIGLMKKMLNTHLGRPLPVQEESDTSSPLSVWVNLVFIVQEESDTSSPLSVWVNLVYMYSTGGEWYLQPPLGRLTWYI